MAREEPRTRSEVVGTTVGLIVFFVGVALLIIVFVAAFRMFSDPSLLTTLGTTPPPPGATSAAPAMTGTLATMGAKILFSFIMLLAASLVASKGIQLYATSR